MSFSVSYMHLIFVLNTCECYLLCSSVKQKQIQLSRLGRASLTCRAACAAEALQQDACGHHHVGDETVYPAKTSLEPIAGSIAANPVGAGLSSESGRTMAPDSLSDRYRYV